MSDTERVVRLPVAKAALLKRVRTAFASLSHAWGRLPTADEIARELRVDAEKVRDVMDVDGFSEPVETEDSLSAAEKQADYTYCPERALFRKTSRSDTMRFLGRLKERERGVILCRYQFVPNAPHTFKDLSKSLGITPEAVRQIELRALRQIRENASDLRDCVYAEAA